MYQKLPPLGWCLQFSTRTDPSFLFLALFMSLMNTISVYYSFLAFRIISSCFIFRGPHESNIELFLFPLMYIDVHLCINVHSDLSWSYVIHIQSSGVHLSSCLLTFILKLLAWTNLFINVSFSVYLSIYFNLFEWIWRKFWTLSYSLATAQPQSGLNNSFLCLNRHNHFATFSVIFAKSVTDSKTEMKHGVA